MVLANRTSPVTPVLNVATRLHVRAPVGREYSVTDIPKTGCRDAASTSRPEKRTLCPSRARRSDERMSSLVVRRLAGTTMLYVEDDEFDNPMESTTVAVIIPYRAAVTEQAIEIDVPVRGEMLQSGRVDVHVTRNVLPAGSKNRRGTASLRPLSSGRGRRVAAVARHRAM